MTTYEVGESQQPPRQHGLSDALKQVYEFGLLYRAERQARQIMRDGRSFDRPVKYPEGGPFWLAGLRVSSSTYSHTLHGEVVYLLDNDGTEATDQITAIFDKDLGWAGMHIKATRTTYHDYEEPKVFNYDSHGQAGDNSIPIKDISRALALIQETQKQTKRVDY